MWQSIVNLPSDFIPRFTFTFDCIQLGGYYAQYPRLNNRTCVYVDHIACDDVKHNPRDAEALRYTLSALESLANLDDYWGIIICNTASDSIPFDFLKSAGYDFHPKSGVYEKLLKGFTTQEFNDPKTLQRRLEQEVDFET